MTEGRLVVEHGSSLLCVFSRVEAGEERREVWRLTLENVSSDINTEEKEREQRMYTDVSHGPPFSTSSMYLFICLSVHLSSFPP